EPNEDSESLSRPGSIILSGKVGGVVAQPLGEQNPALLPHIRHIVFAAVVVETKDVGRFSGLGEGGGRKSEERQKRAHVDHPGYGRMCRRLAPVCSGASRGISRKSAVS